MIVSALNLVAFQDLLHHLLIIVENAPFPCPVPQPSAISVEVKQGRGKPVRRMCALACENKSQLTECLPRKIGMQM